jgi:hypothetical protein
MATELLEHNSALCDDEELLPLQHDVHHDLESFYYVFIYAIMKHEKHRLESAIQQANITAKERQTIAIQKRVVDDCFKFWFGHHTFMTIAQGQRSLFASGDIRALPISTELRTVFLKFGAETSKQYVSDMSHFLGIQPSYLTHHTVLQIFDNALAAL